MSFDLEVVSNKRIEPSQLATFFSSLEGFQLTGSTGNNANVLVTRTTAAKIHSSFTVDGPFEVELDDLAEEIIASTLDPRWLVQISVPASAAKADLTAAKDLARFIAESCQGSVYDPQADRVVWPRQRAPRYVPSSSDERIRLVELDWFLPASLRPGKTAATILQILRRTFPEALPTRFGTFEPFQQRLEPGDDQPFIEMWTEQSEVEFGGSFHWKAKPPCYGGDVFFPDWRDKFKPEGADRAIHLSLSIDGRALHSDPRWCETALTLFVRIAKGLRSFYSMGHVQREVIARRRSIWFDGRSEASVLPGKWWLGLPRTPTWLAWFGGGYAKEVETSVARFAPIITTEGILLRLGPEPMDTDQLKGLFPVLPQLLIARESDSEPSANVAFLHPMSPRSFKAASTIPPLE